MTATDKKKAQKKKELERFAKGLIRIDYSHIKDKTLREYVKKYTRDNMNETMRAAHIEPHLRNKFYFLAGESGQLNVVDTVLCYEPILEQIKFQMKRRDRWLKAKAKKDNRNVDPLAITPEERIWIDKKYITEEDLMRAKREHFMRKKEKMHKATVPQSRVHDKDNSLKNHCPIILIPSGHVPLEKIDNGWTEQDKRQFRIALYGVGLCILVVIIIMIIVCK